jgi:hypothetical protein
MSLGMFAAAGSSGGSASPFDDADAWWDAAVGVTLTGGKVSGWDSKVGGYTASQGVDAYRPTLNAIDANFNGLPAVAFAAGSGTNLHLKHNYRVLPKTIFVVARQNVAAPYRGILGGKAAGTTANGLYFVYTSGSYRFFPLIANASATSLIGTATTSLMTTTCIALWLDDGSNIVGQVNNQTATSAAIPSRATPDTAGDFFILGGHYYGGQNPELARTWNGQIAEVIFWERSLDSTERDVVKATLAAKYGITI